jgi:hypothetical protein
MRTRAGSPEACDDAHVAPPRTNRTERDTWASEAPQRSLEPDSGFRRAVASVIRQPPAPQHLRALLIGPTLLVLAYAGPRGARCWAEARRPYGAARLAPLAGFACRRASCVGPKRPPWRVLTSGPLLASLLTHEARADSGFDTLRRRASPRRDAAEEAAAPCGAFPGPSSRTGLHHRAVGLSRPPFRAVTSPSSLLS